MIKPPCKSIIHRGIFFKLWGCVSFCEGKFESCHPDNKKPSNQVDLRVFYSCPVYWQSFDSKSRKKSDETWRKKRIPLQARPPGRLLEGTLRYLLRLARPEESPGPKAPVAGGATLAEKLKDAKEAIKEINLRLKDGWHIDDTRKSSKLRPIQRLATQI